MAAITAGNELYLYQLFLQEVGTGRQVMLARMEEILAQDDIWPCDLGCSDVREVLENLSGFVRLTVFKKGRVYATILPNPQMDAILERANSDAGKPAERAAANKGGAKSWKRKRAKKDPKPTKPRPKGRPKPKEQAPAQEPARVAANASTDGTTFEQPADVQESTAPAPTGTDSTEDVAITGQGSADEQTPKTGQEVVTEPVLKAPTHEDAQASAEDKTTAAPEEEPTPAAEPSDRATPEQATEVAAETEPASPAGNEVEVSQPQPSITFTVTYNPYEDDEFELSDELDSIPEPESELAPITQPELTPPSPTSQAHHPQSFATDVLLRDAELGALYQMLPLDVDPVALLDEDWRVARSTEAFTQEGGLVVFPLRYLVAKDGEPVRVRMRRVAAGASGKRWVVESVDQVDEVGFEGLPTTGSSVMRELAQFAHIGPWEELAAQLARKLGNTSTAFAPNELRDYLCITFHRIVCENKFLTYANGAHGAFDTGLTDETANAILMCFEASEGDLAWRFAGFFTPEEAQLDGAAPLPAAYIQQLSDIVLSPTAKVEASRDLVRAYGTDVDQAIEVAVCRAKRDYRLAAPAYDALTNEVRLLLPITIADKGARALVLRPHEQGFVASAVVSLERAATCARIVSRELPRWLLP